MENGDLNYLGRLDNQIKFHGFRIELDEITAWVEKYPRIFQATTTVYKTGHNHEYLATYFIANEKHIIGATELQIYLRDYLPEYMIPSTFIGVESFPLPSKQISESKYVLPRTVEETALAEIWQNILRVEKISIYDNFFNLRVYSLLALQALLQIKKQFMIELPVRAILDASTIEKLAKLIKDYLDSSKQLMTTEHLNEPLMSCIVPL